MKTRVISAAIAVALVIAIYHFFATQGLLFICAVVAIGCVREYGRLAFSAHDAPLALQRSFHVLCIGVFVGILAGDASGLIAIVLCTLALLTMAILWIRSADDLATVLKFQSLGVLGFLYVGLMPALATRLLDFPSGDRWLFGLLAIVFASDTMAYLVGRKFGKTRLLESVSPKKTVEGAVGGLIGSGLAGFAVSLAFPDQSPLLIIVTAIATGAFAQVGDLFESLLKRVAQVKDSGTIMPGHGGILDRCDGVYFAAPIYYVLIRALIEH